VHQVGLEAAAPSFLAVIDRQRRDIGDDDVDATEGGGAGGDPGFQRGFVGDIDGLEHFDVARNRAF
jgi:hypothetical protein